MILTVIFALLQGQLSRAQEKILVKEVVYDVPIFNANAYSIRKGFLYGEWWDCNIETSARTSFQRLIMIKAMSGEIKVYDDDDQLLKRERIKSILRMYDTVRCQRLTPPFDQYDSVFEVQIIPEDIQWIRFKEQWVYDSQSLLIRKRITSYAPVWVEFNKHGEPSGVTRPLFWVHCDQAVITRNTFTSLIASRMPTYKNTDRPGFLSYASISGDSLATKGYFSLLIDAVESGKKRIFESFDVLSFYRFTLEKLDPVSKRDAHHKIDLTDTFVLTHPYPPYDEYDTILPDRFDPDRIIGLQFFEQWWIDPETFAIEKEVLGMDIIKGFFDYDGILESSIPYFYVAFREPERNFFK